MSYFQRYERNTTGRDFVVGDVHGCFARLRTAMQRAGFNSRTDRLFSVGDLVDRGPDSSKAIEWIAQPWFHAVRGNHEQMAIEAGSGLVDPALHVVNGGQWFYQMAPEDMEAAVAAFHSLPYALEVDTADGLVGIVHAEVPGDDWAAFRDTLLAAEQEMPPNFEHVERFALWGRDLIRGRSRFSGVANVSRVYVGHTPVNDWQLLQNVQYIDTGAVFGRKLTLACISDGQIVQEAA